MIAAIENIDEIFNGGRVFHIPFFQRQYVWGRPQLDRLVEDVETALENKRSYFLGAVIFKRLNDDDSPTDTSCGDVRIVIDGQQRLTALTILFKVLCLKTNNMSSFDYTFRLRDKTLAVYHNDLDSEVYNRIMALNTLEEIKPISKVAETYEYFRKNLDETKFDFEILCKTLNFAVVTLGSKDDEQQIFDAINSLGVRLTTAELLKNYLFGKPEYHEHYDADWKSVFETKGVKSYWDSDFKTSRSDRSMIDPFLFSYLQLKVKEKDDERIAEGNEGISTSDKKNFQRRDQLFDSYKYFIAKYLADDKLAILSGIKECANIFKNAIGIEKINKRLPQQGIERINAVIFKLKTTTVLPYVFFVEKKLADNLEERNKIYDCIEALVVCRILADKDTRGYNKIFSETLIANNILSADALRNYFMGGGEDSKGLMPSYDEIRRGCHGSVKNSPAIAILYLLESKLRKGKNPERSGEDLRPIGEFTLEHIMPQEWTTYWPATDDPGLRNKKLRTLGNFAIVTKGHNSEVSNKSWAEKKAKMREYVGGFKTLYDALDKDQWDEKAIDERAEKLAEDIADVYGIDRTTHSNPQEKN